MKGKGELNATCQIKKDGKGNVILNECIPAESVDEVIKILEECDVKLQETLYYKTAYSSGIKNIRTFDPVLKVEFQIRTASNFMKTILAQIEKSGS